MPLILVNLLKIDYGNKISDIKGKIPSITGLAATTTLTVLKNTIPIADDMSHKAKSNNLYINLTDYNTFTRDKFDAKINKDKLINESSLNKEIKIIATKDNLKILAKKAELKAEKDKTRKLQTSNTSLFIGQSYFDNYETQNYFVFQPLSNILKRLKL